MKLFIDDVRVLLKDYKPFKAEYLKIKKYLSDIPANATELDNMNKTVEDILSRYTVDEYINARGGLISSVLKIEELLDKSKTRISGKILEVGAGIAKTHL